MPLLMPRGMSHYMVAPLLEPKVITTEHQNQAEKAAASCSLKDMNAKNKKQKK